MEVFRLVREQHAGTLSGIGAALRGARWNSIGVELIYTASNRSLAMAEVAVHLTLATLPSDFLMMTIEIPDDIIPLQLEINNLPPLWNVFPHQPHTQLIGDQFVRDGKCCVLRLPSVVTKGDYKMLINPHHADFGRIKVVGIEAFPFDGRMVGSKEKG